MNILTLDVETTISNKGHWADRRNKLVMVGLKWLDSKPETLNMLTDSLELWDFNVKYIQTRIEQADIIIGFNIKFDLHWLMSIGINVNNIKRVWDCQIAEFLLEAQRNPYNSLNDALIKYRYSTKLDVVKTEYWDKGIDTDVIPVPVLQEYLQYDLRGTENVFKKQYEQFTGVTL